MPASSHTTPPRGLWLPLITPFRDGRLDRTSLDRLCRHYLGLPIDGFILAATTGEGLTLDADETRALVDHAADRIAGARPLYLGLSGSDTTRLAARIAATAAWPIDGFLVSCPYYSRPSQDGLVAHFSALAAATDRPLVLYNIPYRTGVNLQNDALLALAETPNIVGLKDCCTDMGQTFDMLRRRPAGFSVLTGEDAQYYAALAHGGDGAILASAHVETARFAGIRQKLEAGDQPGALADWRGLADLAPLLFAEPSPAALKYWLWRQGLIDSPQLRLPMLPASEALAARIDTMMAACGFEAMEAV